MDIGGVFGNLALDLKQLDKVSEGIQVAVGASFIVERERSPLTLPSTVMTQAKIRERGKMCIDMIRQLRGDAKWGIEKIVDHLPEMLQTRLDGGDWHPKGDRQCWTPKETLG